MKAFNISFAIAASLISLTPEIATASESPVLAGKVIRVGKQGHVEIQHKGLPTRLPGKSAPLYNGDGLSISGSSFACIETAEFPAGKCLQEGFFRINVKGAEDHRPSTFQLLTAWLGRPGSSLPSLAVSRGDDDLLTQATRPHPLLPAGVGHDVQFMPAGYARLAPLWGGSWAKATLAIASSGSIPLPAGNLAFVLQPVDREATLTVSPSVAGIPVAWKIRLASAIPQAPGLPATEAALTQADRVDRAAWLLTKGPEQWHLFAFTELRNLGEAGSYEAQTMLAYIDSPDCVGSDFASTCPFFALRAR